jgi:hypothetical protein
MCGAARSSRRELGGTARALRSKRQQRGGGRGGAMCGSAARQQQQQQSQRSELDPAAGGDGGLSAVADRALLRSISWYRCTSTSTPVLIISISGVRSRIGALSTATATATVHCASTQGQSKLPLVHPATSQLTAARPPRWLPRCLTGRAAAACGACCCAASWRRRSQAVPPPHTRKWPWTHHQHPLKHPASRCSSCRVS